MVEGEDVLPFWRAARELVRACWAGLTWATQHLTITRLFGYVLCAECGGYFHLLATLPFGDNQALCERCFVETVNAAGRAEE